MSFENSFTAKNIFNQCKILSSIQKVTFFTTLQNFNGFFLHRKAISKKSRSLINFWYLKYQWFFNSILRNIYFSSVNWSSRDEIERGNSMYIPLTISLNEFLYALLSYPSSVCCYHPLSVDIVKHFTNQICGIISKL